MNSKKPVEQQKIYQRLLYWSNLFLALSVLLLVASILIAYPFEHLFSLPQVIASHLTILATATLLKIAYVGRCVSLYALKREVR